MLPTCTSPSFTYPLYTYNHSIGSAITGGAFYRGSQFPASYSGSYFFSDYVGGFIKRMDTANVVTDFRTASSPVDIKIGPDGSLYYASLYTGNIYKISLVGGGNQNPTAVITATPLAGPVPLVVNFSATGSTDPEGAPLTYTWNFGDGSATQSGVTTSHTYTIAGVYTAALTADDGQGGTHTVTAIIRAGTPPVATITTPVAGTTYNAGSTISYSGDGTNAQGGALPARAFSWTVVFHHATHTHPFLGPITGSQSGTFQIPTTGEPSADVWYRLQLTVTDASGLQHTVTRDVVPNTATFTLQPPPANLQITLDGQPMTAPQSITGVVGFARSIGVVSPQILGGQQHTFQSWSDAGAATHTITTPATNTTYTATFSSAPAPLGVEAAYSFDASSGTVLTEISGNGHHGTLVNSPTWVAGKHGNALSFDGLNDYVTIDDLDLLGPFTVSMWAQAKNVGGGCHGSAVMKRYDYGLEVCNGQMLGQVGNGSGSSWAASTSYTIPQAGVWTYYTLTYDGTTARLYVNGTLQTSAVGTHVSNNDLLMIGAWTTSSEFFDGLIDDVRIYNRALTPAEIAQDMTTAVGAPPCTYAVTPPNQVVGAGGQALQMQVTTPAGCAWTAASNTPWVTITGGSAGTGSGPVAYTVTANPGPNPRRGLLTIAGKPVIISQQTPVPAPCTISVGAASAIGAGGGTGSVSITASTTSCRWQAQSHASWITLTPPTSGNGNGSVQFTVPANSGSRKGRITVNGKRVIVTQN